MAVTNTPHRLHKGMLRSMRVFEILGGNKENVSLDDNVITFGKSLTPEQASKLYNDRVGKYIRPTRSSKVREYRFLMENAGANGHPKWERTEIAFGVVAGNWDQWYVLNGNNRLEAESEARVAAVPFTVAIHVVNNEDEIRDLVEAYDNGIIRTVADKLEIGMVAAELGIKDKTAFGSTVGVLCTAFVDDKRNMSQRELDLSVKQWAEPFNEYSDIIFGFKSRENVGEERKRMMGKLKGTLVRGLAIVTLTGSKPEWARHFWRCMATLQKDDPMCGPFVTAVSDFIYGMDKSALQNQRSRAEFIRAFASVYNDYFKYRERLEACQGGRKPKPHCKKMHMGRHGHNEPILILGHPRFEDGEEHWGWVPTLGDWTIYKSQRKPKSFEMK